VRSNVVVKIVQSRTVEFADLFESFFELDQFELGKVLVEVFGNRFSGRFEDGVPIFPVIIARKG